MNPQTNAMTGKKRALWVGLTLLVGAVLGVFSSTLSPQSEETFYGFPGHHGFGFGPFLQLAPNPLLQLHVGLTTVVLVLLIALSAVYLKVFMDTRAPFTLGLLVIMLVLLLHTLVSYPLVEGMAGPVPVGPGDFLLFADLLEVAGFAIFLYLSLE